MPNRLLLLGGILNLTFGLIHLGLGKALYWSETLIGTIGLFWDLRAINQVVFNGLSAPDSPFLIIVCLVVSSLYWIPIAWKRTVAAATIHP